MKTSDSKIIEVTLMFFQGEYEGQQTVFQRLSDRNRLYMILPYINEIREEYFLKDIPFKWEPNIFKFNEKTVVKIIFLLKEKTEIEKEEYLQNKIKEKQSNFIVRDKEFDKNKIYISEYENYKILKINKRKYSKFCGPKIANKRIKTNNSAMSDAFRLAFKKK